MRRLLREDGLIVAIGAIVAVYASVVLMKLSIQLVQDSWLAR